MKISNYKSLLSFAFLFFILPMISASGLTVTSNSSFVVNYTYGYDAIIEFDLTNDESFTMYNISFETNDIIEMPQILALNPGETKNVTATISTSDNFNGDIKIKGFYQANLGASNETYEIDVDYDDGLSICDYTIVQGDTIVWNNLVNDVIIIRNSETENDVASIPQSQSYSTTFENPEIFSYYFLRRGFIFTNTCQLTVLDDEGLVNNPDYDSLINLNINFNFERTSVELTTFVNNYTIDFFNSEDGVISIRNNGTSIAKNVQLSGDWFLFEQNEFDIDPGYTKIIAYTIKPEINATQWTNQSYNKTLFVDGNFDSVNSTFQIMIPFAQIQGTDDDNNITDFETTLGVYLQILESYCNTNQESEICVLFNNRVVYKYVNETYFDYPMTLEQVDEIWNFLFEQDDDFNDFIDYVKEQFVSFNETLNTQSQKIDTIGTSTEETQKKVETTNTTTLFYGVVITFLIVIIFLVILIVKKTTKRKLDKIERWY